MLINIKDKVNYKNFITILKLIEGVNSIDVTGKDKGEINNVDIKNITSSMNTANDKYEHKIKKLSSSINTANDKTYKKELEDYGKRMGIEPVDLNEDLYDY